MERVILSQSMLLTSILGFIISVVFTVYGRINLSLGVSACLVFAIMFIASLVTMAPSQKEFDELDKAVRNEEKTLRLSK